LEFDVWMKRVLANIQQVNAMEKGGGGGRGLE